MYIYTLTSVEFCRYLGNFNSYLALSPQFQFY
jgi:hypothetical protein